MLVLTRSRMSLMDSPLHFKQCDIQNIMLALLEAELWRLEKWRPRLWLDFYANWCRSPFCCGNAQLSLTSFGWKKLGIIYVRICACLSTLSPIQTIQFRMLVAQSMRFQYFCEHHSIDFPDFGWSYWWQYHSMMFLFFIFRKSPLQTVKVVKTDDMFGILFVL